MQIKLHRWAGEDSSRRFGDLFNLVYDPAFLVVAWLRVSANKGANTAGIDKVTAAWVEAVIGVGVFLGQIRDSLKSGEFRPVEVRQVMIPKAAPGNCRKLGIPAIADRVVQASLNGGQAALPGATYRRSGSGLSRAELSRMRLHG